MPTDKILAEQRRMLGDFEVVEFVDETKVEGLRRQIDVDLPLDLQWTW